MLNEFLEEINYPQFCLDNDEREYMFTSPILQGLSPLYAGYQACPPNHIYGPHLRGHYYYHYIVSGTGTLETPYAKFDLYPGYGFLGFPHEVITYQSSSDTPWTYMWIAFDYSVNDAIPFLNNINKISPIFKHTHPNTVTKLMNNLVHCAITDTNISYLRAIGLIYTLLSLFYESSQEITIPPQFTFDPVKSDNMASSHVDRAIHYIRTNYFKNISIKQIATYIGITENHLNRLFKAHYNVSPSQYLAKYRLIIAYTFLTTTQLNINEIATMCGFSDALYFSKWFKKMTKSTPSYYRKINKPTFSPNNNL